jgi:hypothetical protein
MGAGIGGRVMKIRARVRLDVPGTPIGGVRDLIIEVVDGRPTIRRERTDPVSNRDRSCTVRFGEIDVAAELDIVLEEVP